MGVVRNGTTFLDIHAVDAPGAKPAPVAWHAAQRLRTSPIEEPSFDKHGDGTPAARKVGMSRALVLFIVAMAAQGQQFLPAGNCATCHSRIPDPSDAEVSVAPYPLWRTSVMANAARDPYWRARVDAEMRLRPGEAQAIEQECLRCHAPAQNIEGVTCTACHRISPSGGYESRAVLYGPHADPFAMPMLHHTGMRPEQSAHVLSPELCATCHTVINTHGGANFHEQSPYLEWKASSYPAEGKTCISCHMPALDRAQYIAHRPPGGWFPPTSPRSPFRKHWFRGANQQLLQTVDPEYRDDPPDLLRSAAAIECTAVRDADRVALSVRIRNRTGHKLPTGHPGRRMWLHVKALDSAGRVVYETGDWDGDGEVKASRDLTVFESHIAGGSLVDAGSFDKDNRIPPRGSDGGDGTVELRYVIPVPAGPVRLQTALMFQSVPPGEIRRLLPEASAALQEALGSMLANGAPRLMASKELQIP